MSSSYVTEFAVEMTCGACEKAVNEAMQQLKQTSPPGAVGSVQVDLAEQRVVVESSLPSSTLLQAIESTGRKTVLRGQGDSFGRNLGSAVSILERDGTQDVIGVVRFVQISENECVIEGTLDGLSKGEHGLHIHEYGDLSQGWKSAGGIYNPKQMPHGPPSKDGGARRKPGAIGNVASDAQGRATFTLSASQLNVWDIIGHALVVHERPDDFGLGNAPRSSENGNVGAGVGAGIIARSAGLLGNAKRVCACDGKTLWSDSNPGALLPNKRVHIDNNSPPPVARSVSEGKPAIERAMDVTHPFILSSI
ncbi:copper chaperone for superoxide dismutase [Capsaspora owczarzaki ATCC 30864]|uniref:copper chaperone for superoxide dismutase n=1 Tax=Capsaspora owczarzaki (strain ATCC 30864) TaxID=595528 RepID=UPI0003520D67|nr:copper chaperone for superoxide dismutase [Capsaspora owczarzaki ATCC 30864]|eukprot:XP_004342913.2 copper chaperone for superoxide dismutase [Capsaspora owczarzaki ATCC 30864]